MTAFAREPIEIIPEWLLATRDLDIATGLSREEALLRARKLRHLILEGKVSPKDVELDEEGKDVLYAVVRLLSEEPFGEATFQACDRVYKFFSRIAWAADSFGELDDLLRLLARLGWRAAPTGIEAVLEQRASVWDRWDSTRYKNLYGRAGRLGERIRALTRNGLIVVDDLRNLCSDLLTLASLRPAVVEACASSIWQLLLAAERPFGYLDDRENLFGLTALAAGIAARQRGNWKSASEWYQKAEAAFRKTVEPEDVDRVNVERFAFLYVTNRAEEVTENAPALIRRLKCPLERAKANLVLAAAHLSQGQPAAARVIIETALEDQAVRANLTLRAWFTTKLGNALSAMGLNDEADATFQEAIQLLGSLEHPLLLALLFSDVGEHLTRRGKLLEATHLYRAGRQAYRVAESANFVVYMSVMLAELLFILGRVTEAETELLDALPMIEEFQLEREGIAAVALLRELVARNGTNLHAIQTLREHLRKGLH